MEMNLFYNELSLFIFLACFVCFLISPSDQSIAALAIDVTDRMKTRHESTLFRWANVNIYTVIKEICSSVTAMKRLRNDIIMTGKMRSALSTCIHLRTFQINHRIVHALCVP
jgi:hypothetical protein